MNTKDVSDKSIRLIEVAVKQFLGERPCVTDWGVTPVGPDEKFNYALTMGSYFERIFQIEFWPRNDFELFCLSPAVKNVLVNVFHFDAELVGCFSRYDLFPKTNIALEDFKFTKDTHLFYAGRISPQKNIEFLILTFFYLQMLYSSKLTLHLIGDFDNEYHKDIPGCPYGEYKNKISTLIQSLPWPGSIPELIHGKSETEWVNFIPEHGIFFSCSDLISEDFSVTAAQLEAKGTAMLLPHWGGFADVTADNVRFFPSNLIANSHMDLKAINSSAKKFATEIVEEKFSTEKNNQFQTFFPKKKINRSYLEQKILENKNKWGNEIDFLIKNQLPQFVLTETGQKIFKECRSLFQKDFQNKT
jgi:glycosyltransferase involved in cell wall biosynthesis